MADCFCQIEIFVDDNATVEITDSTQLIPVKLDGIFDRVEDSKPTRIYLGDKGRFLSSMIFLQLCRSWALGLGPAVIFDLVLYLHGRELAT